MAASEPSPTPLTRRLFITEGTTKLQFLVDTGTDLCVFPRSATSGRREKSDYVLSAANSTDIHTYDTVTLSLNLELRRDFTWPLGGSLWPMSPNQSSELTFYTTTISW
jgi:hypothetical protein